MGYLMDFLENLVYFIFFLYIGQAFFEFKRRHRKYEKSLIVFAVLFSTILWDHLGVFGKGIVHSVSIVAVLLLYFNEKIKILLSFYMGIVVVLAILLMLFEVILSEIISLLSLEIFDSISLLLANVFLLLGIVLVGNFLQKKYSNKLRKIELKYWIVFIVILTFDASIILILGDFILNTLQVDRKYLTVFFYWCVVIGILIQLILLINVLVTRNVYKENENLAKQFLENQNEHYQYLEKRELETKKFRHDIKNHLMILENLLVNKKYDDAGKYLNSLNEKVNVFSNRISVNNGIADAILNRFDASAQEYGINLRVSGHFPMECYISAYDICTVLSNLLSNAIEAEVECKGKEVTVDFKYMSDKVFIVIENDYQHKLEMTDNTFKSTKVDSIGHGYGLSNVKECVEKNGGYLSISTENNRFKVMIMMMNEKEETE